MSGTAANEAIRVDEVQEGQEVRLPEARKFERIEGIGKDDLGRIVLWNGWGECPLYPHELVDVKI